MLERETGLDISRATLDGWVMSVGQLLIPLTGVISAELLADGYIQADETPVDVEMHDRRGSNRQAYLWQYGRPGGSVVFEFQMGRGAGGIEAVLVGFRRIIADRRLHRIRKGGRPEHGPCCLLGACASRSVRGP